jgi:hypothetical protein
MPEQDRPEGPVERHPIHVIDMPPAGGLRIASRLFSRAPPQRPNQRQTGHER